MPQTTSGPSSNVRRTIADALRVLTFRASPAELDALDKRHLAFGLTFTWFAGMGRYWDNPRAELLQHLGVGSLVYVGVLALFLWVVFKPIAAEQVRYSKLATFISLTSPPALLYAIPVERFVSLKDAQTINVWFLAVVAGWRVALLFFYMRRGLGFGWGATLVSGLFPLTFIVTGLTVLNLEHVVFQIMGGLAPADRSPNDGAYGVLIVLTFLSVWAFVPLLLGYIGVALHYRRRRSALPPGEAYPARLNRVRRPHLLHPPRFCVALRIQAPPCPGK